jgi:hypothetical protein
MWDCCGRYRDKALMNIGTTDGELRAKVSMKKKFGKANKKKDGKDGKVRAPEPEPLTPLLTSCAICVHIRTSVG